MSSERFSQFLARVTACHVVTYFVAGLLAYALLDYRGLFASEAFACYMRPMDSRWVAAGPGLQVIRGLIMAAALYPFRHVFLDAPRGWGHDHYWLHLDYAWAPLRDDPAFQQRLRTTE